MLNLAELAPAERIILGIDVETKKEAGKYMRIASEAGLLVVKLESLLSSEGFENCSKQATKHGLAWLADLKSHKALPATAREFTSLMKLEHPPIGITIHIAEDSETLRVAQDIAGETAVFGITTLTTSKDNDVFDYYGLNRRERFKRQVERAKVAGLKGVQCSPLEVGEIKRDPETAGLLTLVPGVHSSGENVGYQQNIDTPANALAHGADLVVVASEVISSEDPEQTLANIINKVGME